ncbi:hypothetical protein ACHAW6_005607 [Cyclotella cf. meneghiniana]
MYSLPQAGILANKLLDKQLGKERNYQCKFTPGLWVHPQNSTQIWSQQTQETTRLPIPSSTH